MLNTKKINKTKQNKKQKQKKKTPKNPGTKEIETGRQTASMLKESYVLENRNAKIQNLIFLNH